MHLRNPYRAPPDFVHLAESYPALKHIMSGASVNFTDDLFQRSLTEALLHRDFGLKLTLPHNRLCPPVPNRLNYILWLQDIITATSPDGSLPVRGLDVGTGASAIYPLLGCKTDSRWSFVGTEIDPDSIVSARRNANQNNLSDRIRIVEAAPDGPLFGPLHGDHDSPALPQFDFTMCNPPFYSSANEVLQLAELKSLPPNAVRTGAEVEMITPGGEVAFVSRMIDESLIIGTRCKWYTSMLGKLSSIAELVPLLRQHHITYGITEFEQGRTRRWAIVWTLTDYRLPDSLSRIAAPNPTLQPLMPQHNTLVQLYPSASESTVVLHALQFALADIEGISFSCSRQQPTSGDDDVEVDAAAYLILVEAGDDTWSRAARRRKARGVSTPMTTSSSAPRIVCRIMCRPEAGSVLLECNWSRGKEADRALFESLWSHLKRKVEASL
ncbi:hypothetical protein JAAARDRAFT_157432 [Jaapia argillacea MUCL 33604]|uniref:U6 small nuclear RNA (adenine-(43)-N(6))-methyltransferase n=1 Tax=Jaapia argillacea MUCL 33604 TaxID=933084 RepID=A0A067PR04_9AGAM|nr:hypothetical protein JAAARDRAFT_157432 [Jaapia argillacea MUCL 33604]